MAVAAVKHFLKQQKIESSFIINYFYCSAVEESKDLTLPPTLPRQKRIPIRIDDVAPNLYFLVHQKNIFANTTMMYMILL